MRSAARVMALALLVAGARPAVAHVAPSVDDNNRYWKLTPMGDRVRLAYTILFGEVPGAAMRRSIDANRDGAISDGEADAFGKKLAAEVRSQLEVSVDGAPQQLAWAQVVVGMGTPKVVAGTFSVDLVAYLCLETAGGRHQIRLFDRFAIARPGETELKVEDIPGIQIERAKIGDATDPAYQFRFVGPGGPLADDGLELVFVASAKAPVGGDGGCAVRAPKRDLPSGIVIGVAALIGCGLAALVVVRQRRRGRRRRR